MSIRPSDLRSVPLFENITDEHLALLCEQFERHEAPAGEVLFEMGAVPRHFLLLVRGEVALLADGEVRLRLKPIAPIGELGSITGVPRNVRAVVTESSEIWRIELGRLREFFERHGEVAFPVYHNLLDIVATKLRRDGCRMDEMRANLVRTQKVMKRLRDIVLEGEETPLSRTLLESLEELIEHNRRGHYLVEPTHNLATQLRLDDGKLVPVHAMNDHYLRLSGAPASKPGDRLAGVLVFPDGEIAVSGVVQPNGHDGDVLVKLDLLIDEYAAVLRDHLTRVQMLDFVV